MVCIVIDRLYVAGIAAMILLGTVALLKLSEVLT
jgi:hypothetical protein